MEKSANILIDGEKSSYNVDDSYFTHNLKRHRVHKDLIVPASKGMHNKLLNLFKMKAFQKELSELIRK